jgi:hypothetical protein
LPAALQAANKNLMDDRNFDFPDTEQSPQADFALDTRENG